MITYKMKEKMKSYMHDCFLKCMDLLPTDYMKDVGEVYQDASDCNFILKLNKYCCEELETYCDRTDRTY